MFLDDRCGPLTPVSTVDITTASITEPVPTYTEPSGDGIVELNAPTGGGTVQQLLVLPYGTDTATHTFLMALYGWRISSGRPGAPGTRRIWVPYFLSSFTCTLSTVPGLSKADVDQTELFAGTIVVLKGGTVGYDYTIANPAGNSVANVRVRVYGASKVEIRFGLNSSSASCNALVGLC